MKKFLSFCFLSIFLLVSCSTSVDDSPSSSKTKSNNGLAIVLTTDNSSRSLSRDAEVLYSASVTVKGGSYNKTITKNISRGGSESFGFMGVPVGITVNVTVEIKIGSVCVYRGSNSREILGDGTDVIEISLKGVLENKIEIPTNELDNLATIIEKDCQNTTTPNIVLIGSLTDEGLRGLKDKVPAASLAGATLNLQNTDVTSFDNTTIGYLADFTKLVLPTNCNIVTNKNNLSKAITFINKDSSSIVKLTVDNKDSFQNDQDLRTLINNDRLTSLTIKDGATLTLNLADYKILEVIGNNNKDLTVKLSDKSSSSNDAERFFGAIKSPNTTVEFTNTLTLNTYIVTPMVNNSNVATIKLAKDSVIEGGTIVDLINKIPKLDTVTISVPTSDTDYTNFINTLATTKSADYKKITLAYYDISIIKNVASIDDTNSLDNVVGIKLGSDVKEIQDNAFEYWKGLKGSTVTIPNNVNKIGYNAFSILGDNTATSNLTVKFEDTTSEWSVYMLNGGGMSPGSKATNGNIYSDNIGFSCKLVK